MPHYISHYTAFAALRHYAMLEEPYRLEIRDKADKYKHCFINIAAAALCSIVAGIMAAY